MVKKRRKRSLRTYKQSLRLIFCQLLQPFGRFYSYFYTMNALYKRLMFTLLETSIINLHSPQDSLESNEREFVYNTYRKNILLFQFFSFTRNLHLYIQIFLDIWEDLIIECHKYILSVYIFHSPLLTYSTTI